MKAKAARVVFGAGLLATLLLNSDPLLAQDANATLSGTITDHSGRVLPDVKVSLKNLSTGQASDARTDAAGVYSVLNLTLGTYEISVSAAEGTKVSQVTITAGAGQKLDLVLNVPAPSEAPAASPAPADNLPNAPSSSKTAPSLEDLGFPTTETQSNSREQALLDKRTHMLKIHQRLGLITTVPLLATLLTSVNAGGKNTSTASRDLHVALGGVTGDLYFITAYYAIRAPRVAGTEARGPIRLHKALAWIHGPGMILTPILGVMAYDQKSKGEKVHGIAAAHGPVAIVTAVAFGAALLSVSVKF